MSYKITIERIETVTRIKREWARLNAEPGSPYGYTPELEVQEESREKVFEQTVSNLNIEAVIRAINGMPA